MGLFSDGVFGLPKSRLWQTVHGGRAAPCPRRYAWTFGGQAYPGKQTLPGGTVPDQALPEDQADRGLFSLMIRANRVDGTLKCGLTRETIGTMDKVSDGRQSDGLRCKCRGRRIRPRSFRGFQRSASRGCVVVGSFRCR
jgi:hypothetical protein